MGMWNWIDTNLHVESWGVTPLSLAAPFGLVILIMMAGRFARAKGAKTETTDLSGMAIIAVIIGAAFFWIFAGIGVIHQTFR